ncbi:hypothetical protein HIM_11824 [Hirsutella minnesotensis 3608]|uniref:Alpha/beta hydrolase fold-3 domain-containing protein n=1 Tax=Hirsutella minnesotensis 3608 TaxID=1043627 RepID=A0A0F7ZIQ1_9HYPO|nr:hypothetical protein HIM_11824 [Hirsutella minnesotensis 3608]
MALNLLQTLRIWFRPLLVACFSAQIPWGLRWRTLLLQPISLITYSVATIPYLFSRPFAVEQLPITPTQSVRAAIFKSPGTGKGRRLRPLHVDIHGGSFIGGLAESNAVFDERVAKETGAVVVGITYRFAPEHTFPVAIDDVDETIKWIQDHAELRWGADPTLITVGGSSAGGNLALASTQQLNCQAQSPMGLKGIVTFCAAIDLRLSPWEKPRPAKMPKFDPLAMLLPLMDAYAKPARVRHMNDPRLSPTLAKPDTLPERILLVVAAIDILYAEQMAFAERVNEQDRRYGKLEKPRVETMVEDEGFHAYLEVPDAIVKREIKDKAFTRGVDFLRETYAIHGWNWEPN